MNLTASYHQSVTAQGLEHRDLGKNSHQPKGADLRGGCLVLSQPTASCTSRKTPCSTPCFQSFPSQPWHRNVCCSQPSAALSASQPGVMAGSKSPKHTTCQKGKAHGTATSSCKQDSWTPECSSGTNNNPVGFWGEIVEVAFELCL